MPQPAAGASRFSNFSPTAASVATLVVRRSSDYFSRKRSQRPVEFLESLKEAGLTPSRTESL
jgi:hypothetical protein